MTSVRRILKSLEIIRVANGYAVTLPYRPDVGGTTPDEWYVFETLDKALAHITAFFQEELRKDNASERP